MGAVGKGTGRAGARTRGWEGDRKASRGLVSSGRPTALEDPATRMSPTGESDVTSWGGEARKRQGRGRTAEEAGRTVFEQRMGPEDAAGKGH